MIFDLFHSVSDTQIQGRCLGPRAVFNNFFDQIELSEKLGFDTVWLAESHFSSETQKKTIDATIPNFYGEVGLNSDSFQWLTVLSQKTKRLNFGTAIHNIVGGSGGPISSADRVNTLRFIHSEFFSDQRIFRIGVAAGRFPYQNNPFGIVPRNDFEKKFWPKIKRYLFIEALEIFLRLLNGEELSSDQVTRHFLDDSVAIQPRWAFEKIKLVPESVAPETIEIVLGSADPLALETALRFTDLGLFNLSFTPPDQIEKLHADLFEKCRNKSKPWHRSRLPRTVMVFIDKDRKKARERAHFVLDCYIEAMRGTAVVPEKSVLLERALVGDASEIRDQLSPQNPRRFHADDRLMLWFEFNQQDNQAICNQMTYFFEQVAHK